MGFFTSLTSLFFYSLIFCLYYVQAQTTIDLTSANRRPPIEGLPDWSKVGFMQGQQALPSDGQITRVISPETLAAQYGVIANDNVDDTDGLQKAISDCRDQSQAPNYTLLQLPAGELIPILQSNH